MEISKADKYEHGIIYIAFGYEYLVMALNSIQSLRRIDSNIPVCVVTNVLESAPDIYIWNNNDIWKYIDDDQTKNRNYKLDIYDLSPFQKTLYLDCDTIVDDDVTIGFSFLTYFDCAASLMPEPVGGNQSKIHSKILDRKYLFTELPHWNSGVILFKKSEASEEFFKLWKSSFQKLGIKYDQPSLVEAVFMSSAKFLSLNRTWNRRIDEWRITKAKDTFIHHYMFSIDNRISTDLLHMSSKISKEFTKKHNYDAIMANFIAKKRATRYNKFRLSEMSLSISMVLDYLYGPKLTQTIRHILRKKIKN